MFDVMEFEIPTSVDIKGKEGTITYNVLFVSRFHDKCQIGETDYDKKEITIKHGLGDWVTFWTFFHEMQHAISEENNLKLTEKQVNGLEISFSKTVEVNGWLKKYKT